ncbi:hypothetical protein GCM10022256_05160 [Frondihabitans peucedani]|uniref:Uncharacterized protein n=1 Tax=Frondihabitans peucedani TaxID=598626 RepID=A0ABP8DYC5_9MICO
MSGVCTPQAQPVVVTLILQVESGRGEGRGASATLPRGRRRTAVLVVSENAPVTVRVEAVLTIHTVGGRFLILPCLRV